MGYANFQVKMVWVKIQGKHYFFSQIVKQITLTFMEHLLYGR